MVGVCAFHILYALFVFGFLFHQHFHLLLLLEYLTLEHANAILGLQEVLFGVLVALFSNGERLLRGNQVRSEFGDLILGLGDLDVGKSLHLPLFSLALGFVFNDFLFQRIDFFAKFVSQFLVLVRIYGNGTAVFGTKATNSSRLGPPLFPLIHLLFEVLFTHQRCKL